MKEISSIHLKKSLEAAMKTESGETGLPLWTTTWLSLASHLHWVISGVSPTNVTLMEVLPT